MKMLLLYAKSRRFAIVLIAACMGLLWALYGLYYAESGPAIYTLIVLGALIAAAATFDFLAYRRRYWEIAHLTRQAARFTGPLPQVSDPLQAQYLALTAAVEQRRCRERSERARAFEQARLYYTRWSHQVKTPLAALSLLLQDEAPDAEAMGREVLKLSQYVDMALQYQRLAASENDLVLRRCDVGALMRRAARDLSPLFIGKRVRLELGALARTVLTDEKWLSFVLEQVLTNAVKYTPAGGVVRIFFSEGDTLCVSDTGIGIPPEDIPRVFEWGYTGAAGRLDQRATGVGLALCKRTMDLLGHRIAIESAPGQGTTVLLDLSRPELSVE